MNKANLIIVGGILYILACDGMFLPFVVSNALFPLWLDVVLSMILLYSNYILLKSIWLYFSMDRKIKRWFK